MNSSPDPRPQHSTWYYLGRLATYRPFVLLTCIFFICVTAFYVLPLLPGLIVRDIFNHLTGNALAGFNLPTLFALIIAVAMTSQVFILCGNASELTMHFLIATLLHKNALARILEYPGAKALPASPGEAISRLRDDVNDIPAFLTWLFDPFDQLITLILGVIILARINGWLTLAVVIPLVIAVTVVNLLTKRIQRYRRQSHESIAGVTGLIGEIFGAVQAVKVAGTEKYVVAHLEQLNETHRKANLRETVFNQALWSLNTNAAAIGTGVVLLVAARAMQTHSLTVGDFTISGKTTLLRVLLGLLPKDSGEITWNGQLVDDPASFFIPPRSAYTAQIPRLFSETLKDNILMGLHVSDSVLQEAVRSAVLEADIPTLEKGLETQVGPRGAKLSGGQVQRAAAARTFVASLLCWCSMICPRRWMWRPSRLCGIDWGRQGAGCKQQITSGRWEGARRDSLPPFWRSPTGGQRCAVRTGLSC